VDGSSSTYEESLVFSSEYHLRKLVDNSSPAFHNEFEDEAELETSASCR